MFFKCQRSHLENILQVFSCNQTLHNIRSIQTIDAVGSKHSTLLSQRLAASRLHVVATNTSFEYRTHEITVLVMLVIGEGRQEETEEKGSSRVVIHLNSAWSALIWSSNTLRRSHRIFRHSWWKSKGTYLKISIKRMNIGRQKLKTRKKYAT